MTEQPCPFCEIVAGRAPAQIIREWDDALAIVPLGPVVEGHVLVIPKEHVTDFADDPVTSATTTYRASELAAETDRPMNLITSRGREATQSVFHLHLHLVPRAENDGLALPWYSGRRRTTRKARAEEPPRG
jgi:histidine triad (HIT) family protein